MHAKEPQPWLEGAPAEALYRYPDHLRPMIDDLPSAPGVYVFHGQAGDLPLYIGKSINIRSRVLSHLRTADEAVMLRQAKSITHIRTAGEIGALLLEAQMIKRDHPLHNQRLRRARQLCSLQLVGGVPVVVYAKDVDFAAAGEQPLFGLFSSKHAALEHLRKIANDHLLCHSVLGVEKRVSGRPCFRYQLRQCLGACCGKESAGAHLERLVTALEALRVEAWPYEGAIALVERDGPLQDVHVVRNWCHLGTTATLDDARSLTRVNAAFDSDMYKILCRPILRGSVEILPL